MNESKETELQLEYIQKSRELLNEQKLPSAPTYHLFTAGCQMNVLQSESVAAVMEEIG